jgi:TonB family protein
MSGIVRTTMDDSLVYRKSGLGAAQLVQTHTDTLSRPERHVLIMLDGKRTIAELAEIFGPDMVRQIVPKLEERGFAKQIDLSARAVWDGAITQFHPGLSSAEVSKLVRRRRLYEHPLLWIALALFLAIEADDWAINRYRSRIDTAWQPEVAPVPIDPYGMSASNGAIDGDRPKPPAPAPITAISFPLEVTNSGKAAATVPARAATEAVPRDRQASVRSPSRRASAVNAQATTGVGRPSADAAAASVAKVASGDKPAGEPPAAPDATKAETTAASATSPAESPIGAPAMLVADGAANGSGQVAIASTAQPASDLVALRPLRHDPPKFPEKALRDGIVESHVRVRLWVTPEGKVDQVDILEATPKGIFDDEVRKALSLWSFEPPGQPKEAIVELTLKP